MDHWMQRMLSGRAAVDMNAPKDVRPCSTSYENNGKSQVSFLAMKAGCSALPVVLTWTVSIRHVSSPKQRSTHVCSPPLKYDGQAVQHYQCYWQAVQHGSLSRLVASSSPSKISVPILQPHRLHLPLRWQDETHLVQNKWRHARFELSRCGGPPH